MSRSKEEAIAAGVQVRETQHKMKRRKPWHDYHRKGTYMVTLVVEGRRPVLGKLIMSAGEQDTSVELTALGKAIRDEEVQKISAIYKMVEVWKLCIMPDHIHMIVRIKEDLPEGKHLGHIVAGFKGGCSRAWWRMDRPCADAQGVVAATDAQGVVAAGMPSIFERGYNDLILLNDSQLDNWKHYLDDNPRRLAIKRLHPEFFTTLNYIDIAEWHCQIVGNRFLLDIPQKVAVIVHSAYSDKEYAEYKKEWLACGEAGGILVSAAIATREKEVMREAMNRGYRIIFVRENGFPPLYKPSGESFDACSNGRLLQICPWEYHMERRIISREQCLMLNRLAEEIAYHQ
jgi:REP element-mobilizing transposase RayT